MFLLCFVTTIPVALSSYFDCNGVEMTTPKLHLTRSFDLTAIRKHVVCSTICISRCKPRGISNTVVTCNDTNVGRETTDAARQAIYSNHASRKDAGRNGPRASWNDVGRKRTHASRKDARRKGTHASRKDAGRKVTHASRKDAGRKGTHASRKDAGRKGTHASRKDAGRKGTDASRKDAGRKGTHASRKDTRHKGTHASRKNTHTGRNGSNVGSTDIWGKKKRKDCTKYRKSMQLKRGRRIIGYNDKEISQISIEDCERRCLHLKEFFCKSFDFWNVFKTCILSKRAYADVPKANRERGQSYIWTHGKRVCEVP